MISGHVYLYFIHPGIILGAQNFNCARTFTSSVIATTYILERRSNHRSPYFPFRLFVYEVTVLFYQEILLDHASLHISHFVFFHKKRLAVHNSFGGIYFKRFYTVEEGFVW